MKVKLKVPTSFRPADNQSIKIQLLYFMIVLFLSVIFGSASVYAQEIRNLKVRKGHPVLFVTPEMVNEIRQKKEDLEDFHNYVKNSREKNTDDPGDKSSIRSEVDQMTRKGHVDYYINDCSAYGVDAYINDNALSKAYAEQYLLSLLSIPISGDDDMPIRGKLFAMGVLYDWIDIFNPLQEWVNGGESHSMGWAYGASYSTFYPYIVWEFATDEESWLTDWQIDKAYFNLYGLRNDYNGNERQSGAYDNFPFWEDVWASEYSANL